MSPVLRRDSSGDAPVGCAYSLLEYHFWNREVNNGRFVTSLGATEKSALRQKYRSFSAAKTASLPFGEKVHEAESFHPVFASFQGGP